MRKGLAAGLTVLLVACAADAPSPRVAPSRAPVEPTRTLAPFAERVAPIAFDAKPLTAPPPPSITFSSRSHAIRARVKPYRLPLAAAQLANFERDIAPQKRLFDAKAAEAALRRDGMVVVDAASDFERFHQAYGALSQANVPVLVTMDSLLHLYHVYFQEILKSIEVQSLAPMLEALLDGVYRELLRVGEGAGGDLREPALIAVSYLAVPLGLLRPEFEPHPAVKLRVAADLARIDKHAGLARSDAMSKPGSRPYREDFSQYLPRGHYTQTEALRRYFKASIWLGRVGHRFEAPHEILSQALLLQALERARCSWQGGEVSAIELFARIDRLLDFFVGESDDLDPTEVDSVLAREIGGKDLHQLARSSADLKRLEQELRKLRPPRILSNAVDQRDHEADADDPVKQATQGLRLLGQRHVLDSDLLGRLVFPFTGPDPTHPRLAEMAGSKRSCQEIPSEAYVGFCLAAVDRHLGCAADPACRAHFPESQNQAYSQVCRLMPSGLDVAARLGSRRAKELGRGAERYCDYTRRFEEMRQIWDKRDERTLYRGWLDALGALFRPPGEGFPTWTRGKPYEDKLLTTALASWTELRHDTVLYVKQSYTGTFISAEQLRPAEFYATIEPAPDVIVALWRLAEDTRQVLAALGAPMQDVHRSINELERLLERLLTITDRQLTGAARDRGDADYLMTIGDQFERLTSSLAVALAPPVPPPKPGEPPKANKADMTEATRTTLVTDVHTDLNTGRVLQEGVGKLRWLLAVDRNPDGQLSVSVGPVFSHYEFVHSLSDRLTDEKWRKLLASEQAPPLTSGEIANGFQRFCTVDTPGCAPPR